MGFIKFSDSLKKCLPLSVSIMMYMGWYGHKDDNYPVSIYKDGTNGNNGFIHDFKDFTELKIY